MKKYQLQYELSPDKIKTLFTIAYDTSKPLGLLLFDWLGKNKGTFCGIKKDRFWLYRTVSMHFFPKKHFSGILVYDEKQSKTKIVGRFVYSPWYLVYPLAIFLLFFFGPTLPEYISRLKYLIVCLLMTCLFLGFSVLIARINMNPRETEILAEMETLLENEQKSSADYKKKQEVQ